MTLIFLFSFTLNCILIDQLAQKNTASVEIEKINNNDKIHGIVKTDKDYIK